MDELGVLSWFFPKKKTIYFVIGDEHAVLLFYRNGILQERRFLRDLSDDYTKYIKQICSYYPEAEIVILLDHKEQYYSQKILPNVSTIGADRIAKASFSKADFNANIIKLYNRAYKCSRGLVYTFIDVQITPNIKKWINYIEQLNNYIKGVYLLPIESYTSLGLYKNSMLTDNDTPGKVAKNINITKQTVWEILVTVNKVSGVRTTVFFAGNIISSNIYTDILAREPDVTAGNLEQMILDIIDDVKKMHAEYSRTIEIIDVYLVVQYDIIRHFREGNIPASKVLIFTPYYYYGYMNIANRSSEDRDRFSDPVLIGAIEFSQRLIKQIPYAVRHEDFYFYHIIRILSTTIRLMLPILSIGALLFCCNFFYNEMRYKNISENIDNLQIFLMEKKNEEREFGDLFDFSNNKNLEQVYEIIDLYEFMRLYNVNPLKIIYDFYRVGQNTVTIRKIDWQYDSFNLNFKHFIDLQSMAKIPSNALYKYELKIDALFHKDSNNYEIFYEQYDLYISRLKEAMKCCNVTINIQSDTLNLYSENKFIPITITITNTQG